jgi:hypothetical protein
MTPEAPMRGNRRGIRRWFWIILVLAALPFAAAVLANLWLASTPGCHWVAAKIQHRTGLEARIGGASVWPWSGVTLLNVELLQPVALRPAVSEPLARISTMRLTPDWPSWLHGKRELRAAALDSPRFVVPVEMLADLAKSQAPPATAAPTIAPAAPPFVGPPAPVPAAPAALPPTATPEAAPKLPAIVLPPTSWLHLKNASFTLFSAASGKPWFEVSGVSGSIPVAGSPARSALLVRTIHAGASETLTDLNVSLDWTAPRLSLKPVETEIRGLKLILAAQLAMLSGLPLQIEAQLPRQPLASFPLRDNGHAEAEAIAVNARFRGLLLAPGSWQGDLIAEALAPSASLAGHDAKFDRGSAVTVLRGGILSCVDARLIGDELSFLGNATLLADGRAAAALRMVAPPESAAAIAARVFPDIAQAPSLTPLSTPQRAAFDVEASGNIRRMFLRIGREGPIVELNHSTP